MFPSGPLKVVLFIDSCCTGQAECIHHFTVHNAMVHILCLLSFNLEGSGQCKVVILLCKFKKSFGQEHLELSAMLSVVC